MGHLRLGRLPMRRNWIKVIELLKQGAEAAQIAAETQKAADKHLLELMKNPTSGFVYTFWLLTQIPLAAKEKNFSEALANLGIYVSERPTLLEITSSTSEAIDSHIFESRSRTDLEEMGQLAALSALTTFGSDPNLSFFETTPEQVQQKLSKLSTEKQFAALSRDFFSNFTSRFLTYFLSAELSNEVGEGKRFKSINDHSHFIEALEIHCKEASKIVEDFSGKWYSKTNYEGGINPQKASNFLHVALKKMRKELKRRAI